MSREEALRISESIRGNYRVGEKAAEASVVPLTAEEARRKDDIAVGMVGLEGAGVFKAISQMQKDWVRIGEQAGEISHGGEVEDPYLTPEGRVGVPYVWDKRPFAGEKTVRRIDLQWDGMSEEVRVVGTSEVILPKYVCQQTPEVLFNTMKQAVERGYIIEHRKQK